MATDIRVIYKKPSLDHTNTTPQVEAAIFYDNTRERCEVRTNIRMDYYEILIQQIKMLASDTTAIVSTSPSDWSKVVKLECLPPYMHEQVGIHLGTATGTKDPLYSVAITSTIITYLDAGASLSLGDPADSTWNPTGSVLGRHSSTYPSESSSCYTTEKSKGIDLLPGSSNY